MKKMLVFALVFMMGARVFPAMAQEAAPGVAAAQNEAPAQPVVLDLDYHLSSLAQYGECRKLDDTDTVCDKSLDEWLANNPQDWGKAAKMIRKYRNWPYAMPYFRTAVDKKEIGCEDPELATAVTSTLGLTKGDETGDMRIAAAQDVASRCFDQLKDAMEHEMTDKTVFANICPLFSDRKALGSLRQKKCDALKEEKK
jgi:hypothetical protein